jgi:lysozyme
MRKFNDNEKKFIKRLIAIEKGTIVSLHALLEDFFFTESFGRALIIQSQGKYGVFFMKKEIFDNPFEKKEQLESFLNLLSFISYLRHHGYISLFRSEKSKEQTMFFIQDGFVGAKASKNTIILNTEGDYTSSPDTIHDKSGNIIYKGVVSRDDSYELIVASTVGSLIVNMQIEYLLKEDVGSVEEIKNPRNIIEKVKQEEAKAENKSESEQSTKHPTAPKFKTNNSIVPIFFSVITLFIVIALSLFAYLKILDDDSKFKKLVKSNESMKSSITLLVSKSNHHDSLLQQQHPKTTPISDVERNFYGIDVSKWNGNEVTLLQKKDSISFIILKATEGERFVDSRFDSNWELVRSNNYILGAYHFYLSSIDPIVQASHFWSTINSQGKTDIAPIVDIEYASLNRKGKNEISTIQKNLLAFLEHIESESNRVPIIYTDSSFANQYLLNDLFSRYPLWLAQYTKKSNPELPKTWQEKGYKIWQRNDNYFIDSHVADFDLFYGTKAELVN